MNDPIPWGSRHDPFKYEPLDGLEHFMPSAHAIDQLVIMGEFILAMETMFPASKLQDHESLP